MAEKFRTEVVADPAPYAAGMAEVTRIAQDSARKMSQSMEGVTRDVEKSLQGTFSKIEGWFLRIQRVVLAGAAVMGGGAMFGAAVAKTTELTKESINLSRALGIEAQEAGVLAIALGDIHSTSDALLGANNAMTRTLRENEQGIRGLGVATRDSSGAFRPALDIILDVNKHLNKFEEGTNRNIEGQKAYKKAWEEVRPILKLNSEVMEEARLKAERLNMTMGPEHQAMVAKYRAAMNDVEDVNNAVANNISDVVMPVLTDMGVWYSETGPERISVMRQATAGLVATLLAMKGTIEIFLATVDAAIKQVMVGILTVAETLGFALKGDFSGAVAVWKRGMEQMGDIGTGVVRRVARVQEEIGQVIARGFFVPTQTFRTPPARTGRPSEGGEDKGRMQRWEAELAAERNAFEDGQRQQYATLLDLERDFWSQRMALAQGNAQLLDAVTKKFYDVERNIRKAAFEAEIADIKAQMAAAETSAEQRIALAAKVYEMERARPGGATSKATIDALRDLQKATDDWAKQQREIRQVLADSEKAYQLSRVELERQSLETMEQMGLITAAEKIARLRELKAIEYRIELEAQQKLLDLINPTTDPVKYEEAQAKLRELKMKHVREMAALDDQTAMNSKKTLDKWLDPAADAFQQFVNGVIAGTRKWTDVLRNTLLSVAQQYAALGVKLLIDWVKTEVLKTQATAASVAARTSAETACAAVTTTTTGATAVTTIGAKAWEAAASVYASIAQIPVVGPVLAPAMAIAAAAMVLGFVSNIAKAQGGFDVPAGINPLTQLHEKEMVLPAHLAERVRGMTDSAAGATTQAAPIVLRGQRLGRGFWAVHEREIFRAGKSAFRDNVR